jgi:hypothetical protein
MMSQFELDRSPERGVALLITVFVLLMVGAVAIAAISNSGQEATASARMRASLRALYTADAGAELATSRLAQFPPNLVPFDIDLGDGRNVQSRPRSQTTPQPLALAGTGPPPDGYGLPGSGGSAFLTDLYMVNVTSTTPEGSVAEIEAKLGLLVPGSGGY